jgi:hypothetical protein
MEVHFQLNLLAYVCASLFPCSILAAQARRRPSGWHHTVAAAGSRVPVHHWPTNTTCRLGGNRGRARGMPSWHHHFRMAWSVGTSLPWGTLSLVCHCISTESNSSKGLYMGLYSKIRRYGVKNQLQQGKQMDLYFACPSKFPLQASIPSGPPNPPPNVGPTIFFLFLPSFSSPPSRDHVAAQGRLGVRDVCSMRGC